MLSSLRFLYPREDVDRSNRKCIVGVLLCLVCTGCATTMYSRPLAAGEEPARLETIVAVDLLTFDGQKPAASTWNSWQIAPGPHKLTARVKWGQSLMSDARTFEFAFARGHKYWLGFRGDNKREVMTPQGTVATGTWEMALYDKTEKCVILESGTNCRSSSIVPWGRGWWWSTSSLE